MRKIGLNNYLIPIQVKSKCFKKLNRLFVVLCEYPHKTQRGLELKIILP